jgi:zinc transporter, ZIP family
VLHVLAYSLLPAVAAIVGAVIATFRPPTPTVRSYLQHLAAGVVFSVVAVELLPDIRSQHEAYVQVVVGFVLGVASMLAVKAFSHKLEERDDETPLGLLAGVGVDILLDGFLIGVSFAAGTQEGMLLTFALTLELLSLGLAVAAALGQREKDRRKVTLTSTLLFSLIVVGALLGTVLLQYISESLLEIFLSFGLAALLYLVTEELLVEAHEAPETPAATGMFFVGFLVFLLLGMFGR